MKDACQRHIDDLAKMTERKFSYRFNKDLAEQAARFIQLLPHTKGEWAFKRMPITLEPWQLFIICSVFGWVHKSSQLRRFREVYTEIPVKMVNPPYLPVSPCIVLRAIANLGRKFTREQPLRSKPGKFLDPLN